MSTEEFSNTFDTLLSSYLHNSQFGELSSYADVTLDEYEKSVLLTLALDLIVKTYFDRTLNTQGLGLDDSSKRQLDYANLLSTAVLDIHSTLLGIENGAYSDRGYVVDFNTNLAEGNVFGTWTDTNTQLVYYKTPLIILNERVITGNYSVSLYSMITDSILRNLDVGDTIYIKRTDGSYVLDSLTEGVMNSIQGFNASNTPHSYYVLLPSIVPNYDKSYVIVPMNFKDYDRMLSRAYNEPLKRLAWRLFETNASDLTSTAELILRSDAGTPVKYVVRYVRRPKPIILVDLSNTDNDLTIDGVKAKTECELNPVLHNDILLLAVQMALTTRGIETRDMKAAREQQERNNK